MSANYYRLDTTGVSTEVWSFPTGAISESRYTKETTKFECDISPVSENTVQGYSGIQTLTAAQYNAYADNVSNWLESVVGARPPKKP